jgi:hypothetical protein
MQTGLGAGLSYNKTTKISFGFKKGKIKNSRNMYEYYRSQKDSERQSQIIKIKKTYPQNQGYDVKYIGYKGFNYYHLGSTGYQHLITFIPPLQLQFYY